MFRLDLPKDLRSINHPLSPLNRGMQFHACLAWWRVCASNDPRGLIRRLVAGLVLVGACAPLPGQDSIQGTSTRPSINSQIDQLRPNYVLRPGDQILIRAFEMEEISEKPFRIDGDGFLNLPTLGRIKAGGITVETLEGALVDASKRYVRQPQVSVTVVQFSTEPVFFVGAFKAPGIYPLGGQRTLVEMISAVGGLTPTASRRIKLTRRSEYGQIPLPNATPLTDGSGSAVEINMASLRDNVNPAEDILLQPFDVISVDRAGTV